ncbi:hypothetical protein FRX31_007402 [Thalictrum thalictroides]|uniref:Uncharacterized protein n=1 Tax=Thalictrum thalictroides TaxID=46969 RepID=A0A7J6WZW5_THATH|nr:hypothetical protein FRX31_007402 [Thalictrum thalictroides]
MISILNSQVLNFLDLISHPIKVLIFKSEKMVRFLASSSSSSSSSATMTKSTKKVGIVGMVPVTAQVYESRLRRWKSVNIPNAFASFVESLL